MTGAERALGRLDGVRSVEAVPGSRNVRITPAGDRTLDFAAIAPAIWSEGIRTLRMEFLCAGRLEPGEGEPRFRIAGWPEAFVVEEDARQGETPLVRAEVRIVDGAPRLRLLPR